MEVDIEDLKPQIEDLASNIDDLEAALSPLLQTSLTTSASKLPLLDQAKLYVLATYALESLLFSSLRLSGVDAKEHPVFKELARVKGYFGKIKATESAGAKRGSTLDKEAAGRFIKHGLAGNDRYDAERAQRMASEKAGAKRKLEEMSVGTHTRFDGAAKRVRANDESARCRNQDGGVKLGVASDAAEDSSMSEHTSKRAKKRERKRQREELGAGPRNRSDAESEVEVRELKGSEVNHEANGGIGVRPSNATKPKQHATISSSPTVVESHKGSTDTSEGKRAKKKKKKNKQNDDGE